MQAVHHLTNDAQPEFTAVRIVRGPADVDPVTPRFYLHYLIAEWSCAKINKQLAEGPGSVYETRS
jgi:hypothetical protein